MNTTRTTFSRKAFFLYECLKLPGTAATSRALKCCRGIYPGHKIHLDNRDFIPSNKIFLHFSETPPPTHTHKCVRINRAYVTWRIWVRSY